MLQMVPHALFFSFNQWRMRNRGSDKPFHSVYKEAWHCWKVAAICIMKRLEHINRKDGDDNICKPKSLKSHMYHQLTRLLSQPKRLQREIVFGRVLKEKGCFKKRWKILFHMKIRGQVTSSKKCFLFLSSFSLIQICAWISQRDTTLKHEGLLNKDG